MAISLLISQERERLDGIERLVDKACSLQKIESLEVSDCYQITPRYKTLLISGGKRDKLRPGDLLGALIGEAKLEVGEVGDISILGNVSYVAIESSKAYEAMDSLNNGRIKKRKFRVRVI